MDTRLDYRQITNQLTRVNDTEAIWVSDGECLPPTVAPDLVPGDWILVDVEDVTTVDGDWFEVYHYEHQEAGT